MPQREPGIPRVLALDIASERNEGSFDGRQLVEILDAE